MDKRYMKAHFAGRKDVDGRKLFTYRATTAAEDRQKDVVTLEGWDFSAYQGNPVIIDSHLYDGISNIVGRAVMPLRLVDGAWEVDIEFSKASERGRLAEGLADEDMLKAVSVGFVPKKIERSQKAGEPNRITEKELLEISVVPVPANSEALRVRGIDDVSQEAIAAMVARALADAPPRAGKVADFNATVVMEETERDLNEQNWRLRCALDEANATAAGDETLTLEQKLAAIATNYQQFAAVMLDWWRARISLETTENATGKGIAVKAGRKLSASTVATIEKAITHKEAAIKLLRGLCDTTDPPSNEDDPENKGAAPPAAPDTTLSFDLSALKAFVGQ